MSENKIIVISKHEDAEVPYELCKEIGANGDGRLFTRNIRDAKGQIEQAENIAKQKEKEVAEAKKVVEEKKKALKSNKEE